MSGSGAPRADEETVSAPPLSLALRLSKGERFPPLILRISKDKRGDHVRLV